MAARYGLIPSELSLGASQGVRRNAADNAFEAVTLTVGGLAGNQSANIVFAGPSSGGAAAPAFRALVLADVASSVLGTGTANSTTFLRGDRTWQTVSVSPAGSNTQLQYNNGGSFGASSNLTFDGTQLAVPGNSETNSSGRFGSHEFQTYAVNNAWFAENIYYNGGFKYRQNGYGTLFYMFNGGFAVRTAPSGTAGGAASLTERFSILENGRVGINITSPDSLLHVNIAGGEMRVGYDTSNYYKTTVGLTGITTFDAVGSGAKFVFSDEVEINGSLTLSAKNIITDTTTGMKIGTSTSQKLGFFNATPVTQRANIVALMDSTGGSSGASIDDVGGSFDQGTLNDNFASIVTRINAIEQVFQDLGLTA